MAKIDCQITENFLREYNRMCKANDTCSKCPEKDRCCRIGRDHEFNYSPEMLINAIQKWSDEHPIKTRLDDLLEKYPKVYISSGNTPSIRPYMLGYCENCDDCVYSHGEAEVCWHEPLVGGATGKAVE